MPSRASLPLVLCGAWNFPLAVVAEPNPPTWPSSVRVFSPSDSDISSVVQAAFAKNGGANPPNNGQFSSDRFAFLFKPGVYNVDVPVGYYTQGNYWHPIAQHPIIPRKATGQQLAPHLALTTLPHQTHLYNPPSLAVLGLGDQPSNVTFTSEMGVFSEEGDHSIGGALSTFWRSAENFKTSASHKWYVGTGMMWAVSQAAPLRRVEVDNDLLLFQYEPPIPQVHLLHNPTTNGNILLQFGVFLFFAEPAGEASGGYMANMNVGVNGGHVKPGSQQQFFARDSTIVAWEGGVWNMVFSGVKGAPASHCSDVPNNPYTTVPQTPAVAEKPYITVDNSGKFYLQVPPLKQSSSGFNFDTTGTTSVGFENVYVTSLSDTASIINAKLSAGLHIVFSAGIYQIDSPLLVSHKGQVLLGLGLATLVSSAQNTIISVGDVDGIRIAGLLLQAGPPKGSTVAPSLLTWGTGTGYAGSPLAPGIIADVFGRVGGPDGTAINPVAADKMFHIINGNVMIDNTWLWRADHAQGGPVTYESNQVKNGLVVQGDNVTAYGLAVEHTLNDLVVWEGNGGQTYFFQSELPYQVTQQEFGDPGYAGYRVTPNVTSHNAWGVGVYCFFNKEAVTVQSAIVVPPALVKNFVNPLTVFLNGNGQINHIINDVGAMANKSGNAYYVCGSDPTPSPAPSPVPTPPPPGPPTPSPPTPPPSPSPKGGCPAATKSQCSANRCPKSAPFECAMGLAQGGCSASSTFWPDHSSSCSSCVDSSACP
eukprot:gene6715-162_t